MLTSFFGKSSPLNFLLVSIYVLFISLGYYFGNSEGSFVLTEMLSFVFTLGILIFSMFVLDFTIRKNGLTLINTYDILLFSCAAMMLSMLMPASQIVISNLFLLLAMRRVFSLQSFKNNERKILDASLWIAIASVFYFWSLLFVVALYIAISLKPQKSVRYFLIAPVTFFGIFLVATAYHYIHEDSFGWFVNWLGDVSFQFSPYSDIRILIFLTFIGSLLIWTVFSKIASISAAPKKDRPNQILSLYVLLVCLMISLLCPEKTGAEFLFFLAPAAIIFAGYIEKKTEVWFKEILLWVFVLIPLIFIWI
ncbi:MAG: DUF6427 family protein [Bacteroidota bacterium]